MLAVLAGLLLANAVLLIVLNLRLRSLLRRYRALLGGSEGKNVETVLMDYMGQTKTLASTLEQTTEKLKDLETAALRHVQRVGIVRFNAFDDVGGEQSFALALLDAGANGVVVSSLCGREETRVYAKPIKAGRSNHTLSTEEIRAIARAIEQIPGS
ncbi:MAG: DUF4446 family protein [Firmicutes bacterium]|nr:DUF4446 family protein [Bacillota bacterium]